MSHEISDRVPTAARAPLGGSHPDEGDLAALLLNLRRLLQTGALALCAGELTGISETSAHILVLASQAKDRLAQLRAAQYPAPDIEICRRVRKELLSIMEARSFFVAVLRRWRRAVRLRRSLLPASEESTGYAMDVTGWS